MGMFNDVIFLNECIKCVILWTQGKTSLKLKHQKNKVNYKEIEVDDYSAPIVVDGKEF
jgi:hypothetical protein